MAKKVIKWGGRRKGAGAKQKPPKEKGVRLTVTAPKKLVDIKGKETIRTALRQTIKQMQDEN